ncbi:glycosyltransferase family 2 protein [Vibrio sp. 404]|uniref:Glycosyltransferase family 2 protein n=1 Tax=Vibrio marinisediminis TaxID=2758441 RepID=A0A7W2FSU0_9VIBR|nr:glycosyltransferase family 2 protein [Vibrio marinisediminis]MBA5763550.1 glycosyltransferase family 2 protein [Vibrio marinisediminis]
MLDIFLAGLFFTSATLVVYHHVGYPILLKWVCRTRPINDGAQTERRYQACKADRARPSITILVPAYNEQLWIAEKIRNLSCLDYPRDSYKVIIACDGCTDNTVEIAEATIQEAICSETYFEIVNFANNRGKTALINHMMAIIDSDITALSDVSALISVDALLLAEQHFRAPNVGVVNSHYQMLDSVNQGELKYWHYQAMVQQGEATLGANIGAHGALFFFRTHLFQPLSSNTINDDFIIPMTIVRAGHDAVYEPNVNALELEACSQANDFKRRLRISAGNMQQTILLAELLLPRYKAVAFTFASGKTLRLITPYLMLICFFSSLLLSTQPLFFTLLLIQITTYLVAVLGLVLPTIFSHRYIQFLSYFITGHSANLYGGLRYIFGRENNHWKRI